MTEIVRKESFHSKGWHAIIAMLMVVGGSACFVLRREPLRTAQCFIQNTRTPALEGDQRVSVLADCIEGNPLC